MSRGRSPPDQDTVVTADAYNAAARSSQQSSHVENVPMVAVPTACHWSSMRCYVVSWHYSVCGCPQRSDLAHAVLFVLQLGSEDQHVVTK